MRRGAASRGSSPAGAPRRAARARRPAPRGGRGPSAGRPRGAIARSSASVSPRTRRASPSQSVARSHSCPPAYRVSRLPAVAAAGAGEALRDGVDRCTHALRGRVERPERPHEPEQRAVERVVDRSDADDAPVRVRKRLVERGPRRCVPAAGTRDVHGASVPAERRVPQDVVDRGGDAVGRGGVRVRARVLAVPCRGAGGGAQAADDRGGGVRVLAVLLLPEVDARHAAGPTRSRRPRRGSRRPAGRARGAPRRAPHRRAPPRPPPSRTGRHRSRRAGGVPRTARAHRSSSGGGATGPPASGRARASEARPPPARRGPRRAARGRRTSGRAARRSRSPRTRRTARPSPARRRSRRSPGRSSCSRTSTERRRSGSSRGSDEAGVRTRATAAASASRRRAAADSGMPACRRARASASNGDDPKHTTTCTSPACSTSSRPRTGPTCATSSGGPSAGSTPASVTARSVAIASAMSRRWKTTARDAGSTKAPVNDVSPPRRGAQVTTSAPGGPRRAARGRARRGRPRPRRDRAPGVVVTVVRSTDDSPAHACAQERASSSSQAASASPPRTDAEAKLDDGVRPVDVRPEESLHLAPRRERHEQRSVADHGRREVLEPAPRRVGPPARVVDGSGHRRGL